jgi:GT2 family glycosyltransferase
MADDIRSQAARVSVIVPTIGRPASMRALLESLAAQTAIPGEVLVADASADEQTSSLVSDPGWPKRGLVIRHLWVTPPNAVRQRVAAIEASRGDYLLLLDDDVELDARCAEEMLRGIASSTDVVAVVADFSNQRWSGPTRAWRIYMRLVLGLKDREWEGRVVGPLLRFGFPERRELPAMMDWVGAGTTLVKRSAYESSGGFSDFFLHRSTMNEDVDLGIKLRRQGTILFWPAAQMAHHHAAGGRVSLAEAAEDDVHNRYCVLSRTIGLPRWRALGMVAQFVLIESLSSLLGAISRGSSGGFGQRLSGRVRGFIRALALDRAR